MANNWIKGISILVGNLKSGLSYLITTVQNSRHWLLINLFWYQSTDLQAISVLGLVPILHWAFSLNLGENRWESLVFLSICNVVTCLTWKIVSNPTIKFRNYEFEIFNFPLTNQVVFDDKKRWQMKQVIFLFLRLVLIDGLWKPDSSFYNYVKVS